MRKRPLGITLAELIIATMLMSFVLAGVFAADLAVRRIDKMSAINSLVYLQTSALAEAVRSDIKQVHGYIDNGLDSTKTGVFIDIPNQTFCFRQDGNPESPANFSDDTWACYTQIPAGTNVYRCIAATPAACASTDTFYGQLVSDQFTNAVIPPPSVTANQSTGVIYFSMLFVGRKVPSAGADVNAGLLKVGTVDNPQVTYYLKENVGSY